MNSEQISAAVQLLCPAPCEHFAGVQVRYQDLIAMLQALGIDAPTPGAAIILCWTEERREAHRAAFAAGSAL